MRTPHAAILLAPFVLPPVAGTGLAGQTKPAQPSGANTVPTLATLQFLVDPKVDMCVGETRGLVAGVTLRWARRPPRGQRPQWQTTNVPNVDVQGVVGPQGGGSISPAMANTGTIGFAGPFVFRAQTAGRTTATFRLKGGGTTVTNLISGQRVKAPTGVLVLSASAK